MQWFALTVKPQHERSAAQNLEYRGFEAFLPYYRARRRWSDRIKEYDAPLFPGYVFCRFHAERRSRILATPSVNSIVGIGKAPAAVSDAEIAGIQTMIGSGLPLGPGPLLKVGQPVRIEDGPLRGLEAILVQVKSAWRVVLNVQLLRRSVFVEVEAASVSAISVSVARQT